MPVVMFVSIVPLDNDTLEDDMLVATDVGVSELVDGNVKVTNWAKAGEHDKNTARMVDFSLMICPGYAQFSKPRAKSPTQPGSVLKVQQKVGSWKGGFGDQT